MNKLDLYQSQIQRLKALIIRTEYQPKRWSRMCEIKRQVIIKRDSLAMGRVKHA